MEACDECRRLMKRPVEKFGHVDLVSVAPEAGIVPLECDRETLAKIRIATCRRCKTAWQRDTQGFWWALIPHGEQGWTTADYVRALAPMLAALSVSVDKIQSFVDVCFALPGGEPDLPCPLCFAKDQEASLNLMPINEGYALLACKSCRGQIGVMHDGLQAIPMR